jgi:DNA-binding winged helix-turn-helix (wHTH) protein
MSMKTEGVFQFGEGLQVDARRRTLRRENQVVTLNRRAFDLLLYLVQNPGKILTRDELLKNVWPDTFVDESSLVQSIYVLRRALEEKPGDNSYIVTLPGRGYQFVSPVKVFAPQSLIFAWMLFHRVQPRMNSAASGSTRTLLAPRRSIAVLGFRNLSGRPEVGWLSTALAEMLSTELVAGEKLRLVSGEDIARTKLELPLADADSLSRNTLAQLYQDLDRVPGFSPRAV